MEPDTEKNQRIPTVELCGTHAEGPASLSLMFNHLMAKSVSLALASLRNPQKTIGPTW